MKYIELIENTKVVHNTPVLGAYVCDSVTGKLGNKVVVHNPNYNQPTGEKVDSYDPETGLSTYEDVLDEREVLLLERPKTGEEIERERKAKVVSLLRKDYSIDDELKLINRAIADSKDSSYTDYRTAVDSAKTEADAWAVDETARSAALQKELDKYEIVTGPKPDEILPEELPWTKT